MTENTPQGKEEKLPSVIETKNKLSNKNEDNLGLKGVDVFKLLIAFTFVTVGVWAFYDYSHLPIYTRYLFPAVGIILGLILVLYWCDFGKRLVLYIKASIVEFKKVVWPVRKDSLRMTLFVVIFVAILSLFIYAADSLISWLFFDLLLKRG